MRNLNECYMCGSSKIIDHVMNLSDKKITYFLECSECLEVYNPPHGIGSVLGLYDMDKWDYLYSLWNKRCEAIKTKDKRLLKNKNIEK